MTKSVRILRAGSAEWNSWIEETAHDFTHTAAYHEFSRDSGEGEAYLAVYGTREKFLAWPYLLRNVEECEGLGRCGWRDVTSVYGYPGPVARGCLPEDAFLAEAWQAIREAWLWQRVVTVFSRFHPLLENHRWLAGICGPVEDPAGLCRTGRTVSIDLREEGGARHYKRALRQHIRRGRDLGMTTEVDFELKYLEEFAGIYTSTMERNRAARSYFFPADYFRRLKRALEPHALILATTLAGKVAAAAFVVEYAGVVNPHLAGTSPEFLAVSPFKLLVDDMRQWALRRGNHTVHLGGGRGGSNDSLFRFKSEFSPHQHDFYTGRWVLERAAYQELCKQRNRYLRDAGLAAAQADYFPEYRALAVETAGAVRARVAAREEPSIHVS